MKAINAEWRQCVPGVFIGVEGVTGGIAVVHDTLQRLKRSGEG
jgi:hypothetical protein